MKMLKEFILKLKFVRESRDKDIALLKSYHESKHRELVDLQISLMLGTIEESKIIKIDPVKGIVYMNDKMLDAATVHNFKQEAEVISQLGLWKAMLATLEASAQKRIFIDSKDLNDILAGKMALYNISLMKKILTVFLAK